MKIAALERGWGAVARMPQIAVAAIGAVLAIGCAYDLSFKSAVLDGADYERVFAVCRDVVVEDYQGRRVLADPETGRIESDPVDFNSAGGARREQVYIAVQRQDDGGVLVEVMAPISEMVIDSSAENPVRWVVKGSDVQQEQQLLDRIVGQVLLDQPTASAR